MAGFEGDYSKLFDRLDDSCVYHAKGSKFIIEETNEEGKAKIQLSSKYDCFHVQLDRKVFPILRNQKCADYIVLLYDSEKNDWFLHIFEFTRTVGTNKWKEKIIPQFEGALINAYAICGVMNIPKLADVTVHCAYRNNSDMASPASMKTALGRPVQRPWILGSVVDLLSFKKVEAKKDLIQLEVATGDGPEIELS